MTTAEKAKQLAEAHWVYIQNVLDNTPLESKTIDIIGFHYQSAMIHGYGHGFEDAMDEIEGRN